MPRRPAISLRAGAVSSACARLSSTQGPAIIASGKPLPKRAFPAATTGLGVGRRAAVMAGPWGARLVASTGGTGSGLGSLPFRPILLILQSDACELGEPRLETLGPYIKTRLAQPRIVGTHGEE